MVFWSPPALLKFHDNYRDFGSFAPHQGILYKADPTHTRSSLSVSLFRFFRELPWTDRSVWLLGWEIGSDYFQVHHFPFVSLKFFSDFFLLAFICLKSTNALCLLEEELYQVALYFTLHSFPQIYYKVLNKIGLSTQKLPQLTLLHPSV